MGSKVNQRTAFRNATIEGAKLGAGNQSTATAASNVTVEHLGVVVRRERYKLSASSIAVAAADDFGSLKLCDLPTGKVLLLGVMVDLSAAVTGTGSNLANVDFALGTAATASADFSGTNEKNVLAKLDCAAGVIDGVNTSAEQAIALASGAKAVYLNVASGNISTAGTVVLTGFIEIFFIEMGVPT